MADFEVAYKITLGHEGGYSNDPDDKGGETYKGIARTKNAGWDGWKQVDVCKTKPNFPASLDNDFSLQESVKKFYKALYWDANNLDHFSSQEVGNEMFDTGVNQGVWAAGKYLQEALNLLNKNGTLFPDLVVDSKIGATTVSVLNAFSKPLAVLKAMNILQGIKYIEICKKDPSQEKYFLGWLNRV
jgi:lysozyme family protein